MALYIKVGHEPRNIGQFTSRAFSIRRVGKIVYRKWGAIKVAGVRVKQMKWESGYPQVKDKGFNTIEAAQEFMRVSIRRKITKGYEKVSGTISK